MARDPPLVEDPRQRLSVLAVFGSLLSFAGVLVIVSRGHLAALRAFELNAGDVWILISAMSWAGYTVCLRWRPAELGGLDLLTLVAAISVALLAPLCALEMAAGRTLRRPARTGARRALHVSDAGVHAALVDRFLGRARRTVSLRRCSADHRRNLSRDGTPNAQASGRIVAHPLRTTTAIDRRCPNRGRSGRTRITAIPIRPKRTTVTST